MKNTLKHSLTAAAILGVFSVVGMGLVSLIFDATAPQIAENERQALLRNLSAIVPKQLYDNDIISDNLTIDDSKLGAGKPITVYRARKAGKPMAAVFTSIAPDGYNGNIKLLVAVKADNTLAGVRVVAHKETPGLGDGIDEARSDWVQGFTGKFLNAANEKQWAVKRDGGEFDQFTGATITPRAVVKAVKNTLKYYQGNADKVYAAENETAKTKQED